VDAIVEQNLRLGSVAAANLELAKALLVGQRGGGCVERRRLRRGGEARRQVTALARAAELPGTEPPARTRERE
jgi:hypothetical protein